MGRIDPINYENASPASQAQWDDQLAAHGRMTNMKKTLAHSPAALHALMEWYPLRDEVQSFLGERPTMLFAHAISSETDCLICSTFFRRILTDWGENPDELKMDEKEQLIVEYGRQLVKDAHLVSDDLHARLSRHLSAAQIVALTAFGAIMIATNLVNNALRVELDEYLWPYRSGEKV